MQGGADEEGGSLLRGLDGGLFKGSQIVGYDRLQKECRMYRRTCTRCINRSPDGIFIYW